MEAPGQKFNLAIIEADAATRRTLSDFFMTSSRVECVLAVDSVEKFLRFHRDFLNIHLVLLEDSLNGASGIDGIPLIRQREPDAEIVMFTANDNAETIVRAFTRGATGFLLKELSLPALEQKIVYSLERGGVLLSSAVARKLIAHFRPVQLLESSTSIRISERESVVIQHLMNGLTYQQIGTQLGISLNGVRQHVYKIYRKLNIHKRHQLLQLKERGVLR